MFSEEVTSTFQTYNHSYCHTVKQDVVVNQGEIDAAIAHNIKLKVKIKNDWFVELRNEYPEFSDDVLKYYMMRLLVVTIIITKLQKN